MLEVYNDRNSQNWNKYALNCAIVDDIFNYTYNFSSNLRLNTSTNQSLPATAYDTKSKSYCTFLAPSPQALYYDKKLGIGKGTSEVISIGSLTVKSQKATNNPQSAHVAKICLSSENTLDSLHKVLGDTGKYSNACVVNFANPTIPGGYSWWGWPSQEQSLCVATDLLPHLCAQNIRSDYYDRNSRLINEAITNGTLDENGKVKAFNGDITKQHICSVHTTCVFTPEVHQLKDAKSPRFGMFLDKKSQIPMSVITIAAPSISKDCSDRINTFFKNYRQNRQTIESHKPECQNYFELCKQQWRCILSTAHSKGVKHLVLGALGCGKFGGNPTAVALALCEVLKEEGPNTDPEKKSWLCHFDNIIISILTQNPKGDANYQEFDYYLSYLK